MICVFFSCCLIGRFFVNVVLYGQYGLFCFCGRYNSWMINQNCIDVKHVGNLSVAYLTRFFGSAGPVLRVDKNQNSKYVTIEFANRLSVDKALRFEGRILDKQPIRIRMYKQKIPVGGECANTASSAGFSLRRREQLGDFREGQRNTGRFKEDLWGIVYGEMRLCDFEENEKLANAMLLWRLGVLLMGAAKHLQHFGVNSRGNYLMFQLQQELCERLQRKLSSAGRIEGMREWRLEVREGAAWLWYSVAFPNAEEEESKVEAYSAQHKCLQRIERATAVVAHVVRALYACSYIYAPEEASLDNIAELQWEAVPNPEDNFEGIVENIGVRDVFYDLLGYQQPNSCLTLNENSDHPEFFECSLRLIGCQTATFEERGWCDIFEAVVWKRWTSPTNYYYHIEVKNSSERLALGQHNLFFEEGQFSCEAACLHYRKYIQLGLSDHPKLFYLRTQKPSRPNTNTFQQLYEDDIINIQDQMEQQAPQEQERQGTFHEEVVVNLSLVEIRQQGLPARMLYRYIVSQLKLEHYLLEYIQESITGKGLIVASQEMAYKLAANIIEREKEGRLFEFAHPRFQKHIGEELWRLYSKQNERKIRNNLVHYQLGKR